MIDWLFISLFFIFFFEICNMPTLEPKGGGGGGGTADFKIEWGKNQNPTENRWTKKSHAEFLSRP